MFGKYCYYSIIGFLLSAFSILMVPQEAHAYLDAGTGSYVIQMVIAAFVGGLYFIKIFWKKITRFFKNLLSKEKQHE